jgi:small nuclear ribonucleoprotein (snRNP)-like protein
MMVAMRYRRTVAIGLIVLLSAASAGAQIQDATRSDAERWREMVVRLEPAAMVTVRLKEGRRMKGTVVSVDAESFMFLPRTRIPVPARDIRFEDLASIERARKEGLNPGTKVVIGAGSIAGGLLLIVAAMIATGYD